MYILGKKYCMTRIFLDSGVSIPSTIIYFGKNKLVYIKKNNNFEYNIQITLENKKKNKLNKSEIGYFKKFNVEPGIIIKSFIIKNINIYDYITDNELDINKFINFKLINVTGISKGKGFSGVIKRWNFSSQDNTHGNSLSHRAPGSIGQNQSPGRVFKGKKMAGHLGCKKVTIKNIKILKFDLKNKFIFVKGSIPGNNSCNLVVKFLN